ncbi:MAG: hypothetical protein ABEJ30_08205 [Halorientalis sp.]
MRYKVAPEPADIAVLRAVHGAVPLVPASTDDCCDRVRERTAVGTRDDAAVWLGFLDALGLAARTDRGYRRERRAVDPAELAGPFRERVFLVDEALSTLGAADDPLTAGAVFARVREEVPRWERNRHGDWTAVWRERVDRLLAWAVAFGLAERVEEGYVA